MSIVTVHPVSVQPGPRINQAQIAWAWKVLEHPEDEHLAKGLAVSILHVAGERDG